MSWMPLGVYRDREIHHLIGLEIGSWLGQAKDFIGVGRLRSHSFGPSNHDPVGPPLHHPQVFLLGFRMASVMKRIVKNRRDAQIVFAAILEVACNILREGRILFAEDVATVLQPQNNRSQMLRQTSRHAPSAAHQELVHLALPGQIFDRMGQKISEAYPLARRR